MKTINYVTIALAACVIATSVNADTSAAEFDRPAFTVDIIEPSVLMNCARDADTALYFYDNRKGTNLRKLKKAIMSQPIDTAEKDRLASLATAALSASSANSLHGEVIAACVEKVVEER
jgi:hypothetical protein